MADTPEVAKLKAEIAKLKADVAKATTLRLKVSEKGAVSLYGMSARFPVTLYKNQWLRLLDFADTIRAFIVANDGELSQGKADK